MEWQPEGSIIAVRGRRGQSCSRMGAAARKDGFGRYTRRGGGAPILIRRLDSDVRSDLIVSPRDGIESRSPVANGSATQRIGVRSWLAACVLKTRPFVNGLPDLESPPYNSQKIQGSRKRKEGSTCMSIP